MITLNFFKDGAYVKGHDVDLICSIVSYAMYSCTNDCLIVSENAEQYQSANDEEWSRLGFSFIKIDTSVEQHAISLSNLRGNLWNWVDAMYPNRVKVIDKQDEEINYPNALIDAKQEQGIA